MQLHQRRSGVLLHPTSLPGVNTSQPCFGVLGEQAYRFIDFMEQCHFSYWQVLPLGPTHDDRSPYNSLSTFAGNPDLIDNSTVKSISKQALENFYSSHRYWLKNYALFNAIRQHENNNHWVDWPETLRNRDPDTLHTFQRAHKGSIDQIIRQQYMFFKQWHELKCYAHKRHIQIIGDLPIFVAHDSADVWSHPSLFKLDANGYPIVVAGVPPDAFSETGQRWGNPLYNWETLKEYQFDWWVKRVQHALTLFDWIRLDHFRGFDACWEIPAADTNASNGHWVAAGGKTLLQRLSQACDPLPLIAEDLGVITPSVEQLRDQFNLPGMRILQFAYDSDGKNPYLPHNHTLNSVVYTGTHDNNTTLGWYNSLSYEQQQKVQNYHAWPQEFMPWPLIKSVLASVSNLAVIPMQDLLALDENHRMNTPGTITGNWQWQFSWNQISNELPAYLASLNSIYDRIK